MPERDSAQLTQEATEEVLALLKRQKSGVSDDTISADLDRLGLVYGEYRIKLVVEEHAPALLNSSYFTDVLATAN